MTRVNGFGRVDRTAGFTIQFDGRPIEAFAGDTVASALLAAGVRVFGRSVQLGRPRGVVSAGSEEPTGLIQVVQPFPEPMLLATTVEAVEGLVVESSGGRGALSSAADPAAYDARNAHCEVAVIGAGPAGLAAAAAAAAAGARVLLIDERPTPGGHALGAAEVDWVRRLAGRLTESPNVTVLSRTTVTGYYDGNYLIAVERRAEHAAGSTAGSWARQRIWRIRAAEVVLATGAHERPVVFAGNDAPGVMLAESVREYLLRFGVLVGRRVVLFTTHDDAYRVAVDLLAAGAHVTVVDAREHFTPQGLPVRAGAVVVGTSVDANGTVSGALIRDAAGVLTELPCDVIAVSGGWNPALQLFSQSGGTLRFDAGVGAYVAGSSRQRLTVAGSARGLRTVAQVVQDGELAGAAAAKAASASSARAARGTVPAERHDFGSADDLPPDDGLSSHPGPPVSVYLVAEPDAAPGELTSHFVDLQRDVTVADLARATGAGLLSLEHVKRYTTAGTAHDQGKTSGLTANGVVAQLLGVEVSELGTTTSRAPYIPISFAALAGRERGALYDPIRTTGAHAWHVEHGAVFEDVGQWKRPLCYPQRRSDGFDESIQAAVARETTAARMGLAFMDGSTLGKIDVQGPDAGGFLDLLYTNLISSLQVGSIRYGVMCSVDGMILDDGTVFRLADQHFLITTTTGNAAKIADWMEEWLQTEWPQLRVWCTSVTEQWATMVLVGPQSRSLLGAVAPDLPVGNAEFPFMTWRDAVVAGLPARVARISFSGELAYEINVSWADAAALWDAVWAVGEPVGLTPYGTETMHVLRAEKGYPIIGQDSDGTATPQDLGLGWAISAKKLDYLGKRSHARAENRRPDRKHLVGLLPDDPALVVPEGSQLVAAAVLPAPPVPMLGHVTSSYASVALRRSFALALLINGRNRIDETVFAVVDGVPQPVRVTSPVLFDPDNMRRDGVTVEPLTIAAHRLTPGLPVSPLYRFAERFAALSRKPGTGVRISEAPLTTMVNIRIAVDSPAAAGAHEALGVDLPTRTGGFTEVGTETILALGPDEFLITSGPGHAAGLTATLRDWVGGDGAVTEVSAARTMLRISGRQARTVLSHGCALDLDRLPAGTCAQTLLAQCAVVIVSEGTPGSPDDLLKVLVRSTFAAHLGEWLLLTAAEYAG